MGPPPAKHGGHLRRPPARGHPRTDASGRGIPTIGRNFRLPHTDTSQVPELLLPSPKPLPPLLVLLAVLLPGAAPAPGTAQSLTELLLGIQEGGGWVRIPVDGGEGSLRTAALPIGTLSLTGCMQVWGGHSGFWEIRARDISTGERLDLSVQPGEPRTFAYLAGAQAQLQVDVRWSEPRDTTLLLWVGLESPSIRRDPCEPVYGRN